MAAETFDPQPESKLAVPNAQAHREGSVTPSDQSFIDEKEKAVSTGASVAHSEHENSELENTEGEKDGTALAPTDTAASQSNPMMKLLVILLALILSMFLVALDMTIVATAIPRITDEFRSLQDVGWYGSAFFLTVAAFQSTWGKAYKYFPLKTAFLISIFWFEVGSLICAVAQNSTTLIVGRAIAGAGGAGIAAGCYTIIAFTAPPDKAAAYTGILGAVYGVASVVGPLLGGVFTDSSLGWRWCFYINLPIGGVSAGLILILFKTPRAAKPVDAPLREKILQMDPLGTVLLMGAIVCLLLALQWGGVSHAWSSSEVVGLLVGFFVIIGVFIAWEIYQGDRALLVPRLLKKKTIALLSSFQFLNSGAFMLLLYFLPLYFQVVSGVSAANSGVRNLPYILGISIFTVAAGIGISVTGHYLPLLIIGGILGTIGNGLIFTLGEGSPSREWIGYQALSGIGTGLAIQIPIIVAQAVVDPGDISSITAIIIFFQTLSGAVFIQTGQALFQNELIKILPTRVPGVDPLLVVGTGATELRHVFGADQIPGIITSFLDGLKDSYILAIALAGVATCIAVLAIIIDNRNLKGKKIGAGAA